MLQDTYTHRTTRGHVVRAYVVWRERTRDYIVATYVNGRRKCLSAPTPHLSIARKIGKATMHNIVERLEAAPERRRPFDRRRLASAYYVDTTPPASVPGFRRVERVRRCVICGARNIGACDAGERCPFFNPKLGRKP